MKRRKRIIINADDLGISQSVNRCIEDAISKGLISSASLIVNAPAFREGVRIALNNPQISVGIHLNLIEFSPLSNHSVFKKYGMLDDDGCFIEGAAFVQDYTAELKRAVFEEWDQQINLFKESGLIPSHIDSHQHTHSIRSLQEVLVQLMLKHNLTRVRLKYSKSLVIMFHEKTRGQTEILDKTKAVSRPRRGIVARCFHLLLFFHSTRRWNHYFSKHFTTASHLYSYRIFLDNYRFIKKNGVIELMCHPGHPSYQYETEELFTNALSGYTDYELLSYLDI